MIKSDNLDKIECVQPALTVDEYIHEIYQHTRKKYDLTPLPKMDYTYDLGQSKKSILSDPDDFDSDTLFLLEANHNKKKAIQALKEIGFIKKVAFHECLCKYGTKHKINDVINYRIDESKIDSKVDLRKTIRQVIQEDTSEKLRSKKSSPISIPKNIRWSDITLFVKFDDEMNMHLYHQIKTSKIKEVTLERKGVVIEASGPIAMTLAALVMSSGKFSLQTLMKVDTRLENQKYRQHLAKIRKFLKLLYSIDADPLVPMGNSEYDLQFQAGKMLSDKIDLEISHPEHDDESGKAKYYN